MNNWTNNAYDNNAYIIGQQPVELKFTNHTRSTEHVPVKKPEKHHPSTGNGLHVPANHSSVNEGFQELEESVGKLNQENPAMHVATTSKQLEANTAVNEQTEGVALSSQEVPAETKEGVLAANASPNQANGDGTV